MTACTDKCIETIYILMPEIDKSMKALLVSKSKTVMSCYERWHHFDDIPHKNIM